LKGYFNTGDKPTELNFADLIDSFYHAEDPGWADYADSQYTAASPFSISADTDTAVPNDALNGPKTYEPTPPLYDASTQKILGRNGETLLITLDCKVVPQSGAATWIDFWFDIGGSVGELYRRISSFPKGSGVARNITLTTFVYTLDTWEANGADVLCRSNGPCNIYDIRYVIARITQPFS
jgi:hypothetical protein